jgi:alanine dehydrogenase
MIIGIPKEVKKDEHRIAVPPSGVRDLVTSGHTVFVEAGAGVGSEFSDQEYQDAGAIILPTAEEVWGQAQMVVKVKEPQPEEYPFMRPDLILFTYLHLAADRQLTDAMIQSGITGIAYETVTDDSGRLPLLEPMSEVAGRMSAQIVAQYLTRTQGGRGVLMGGVAGVRPANVVVLGGGTVGTNAAKMALGMGANVTLLDINIDRLRYLDDTLHGHFTTLYSNVNNIMMSVEQADAVIGAVLLLGARAPQLISRSMLSGMRKHSVIVDVAVDQGGCVETTHPTTHSEPTYYVDGVLHYGVANMPGAVPRTSSLALINSTLRYIKRLANQGIQALMIDPHLANGLNVHRGLVTHSAVADTFNLSYTTTDIALAQTVA